MNGKWTVFHIMAGITMLAGNRLGGLSLQLTREVVPANGMCVKIPCI